MSVLTLEHIISCEEKLKNAMMTNSVKLLDELLSDKLQFVVFDGTIISKQDDLDSHRTKMLKLKKLEFLEQKIEIIGDTAVVAAKAKIEGEFAGNPISQNLRYLRIWMKTAKGFQVIAGSVTNAA